MAKKITVNQDLCVGCGVCVSLYPDVFEMQDDGKAKVISNGNCDHNDVIDNCPVEAIKAENI